MAIYDMDGKKLTGRHVPEWIQAILYGIGFVVLMAYFNFVMGWEKVGAEWLRWLIFG